MILIIEEFFHSNPDILLYMCDSANYGQQAEYYTCTEMVKDGEEENYIALIVKRDHPQLQMNIDVFNKQIAMFRANKPQ